MTQLGREVSAEERARMVRGRAHAVGALGFPDERRREQRRSQGKKEHKLSVKGRVKDGQIVWDIFDLTHNPPRVVMKGCPFYEEACFKARDHLLGRVSGAVQIGNVNHVFGRAGRGLAKPLSGIDLASDKINPLAGVKIKRNDTGMETVISKV